MAKDPSRVSEGDLIIPALEALAHNEVQGLSTSELTPILRAKLNPTGKDIEISPHRSDDYFSEKVRNLKSHNTLQKKGLADYQDGRFYITSVGKEFLEEAAGVREVLIAQGFKKSVVDKSVTPEQQVFVEEGFERTVSKTIKERSRKLRDLALKKFSDSKGNIRCRACGFEGGSIYGQTGKGLIEIHHIKPISSSGATKQALQEALKNVAPLCPNCHRMVHIVSGSVMDIKELKRMYKENGGKSSK